MTLFISLNIFAILFIICTFPINYIKNTFLPSLKMSNEDIMRDVDVNNN